MRSGKGSMMHMAILSSCLGSSSGFISKAPYALIRHEPKDQLQQHSLAFSNLAVRMNPRLGGGEWDNDDFLEGLSFSPPEGVPEKPPQAKKSEDEDAGGGSERFRRMKEAAERGDYSRPTATNTNAGGEAYTPPPPPPPGYYYDPQSNQYLPYPNATPPPPQPAAAAARKSTGRRRPEDKISNTSDLYLEQLKIDSRARNRARQAGDVDKANQPLKDESIHKLVSELQPRLSKDISTLVGSSDSKVAQGYEQYLAATQQEEDFMSTEEQKRKQEQDKKFSGISYKERMQAKLKRNQGKEPPKVVQDPPPPPPASLAPTTTTTTTTAAPVSAAPVPAATVKPTPTTTTTPSTPSTTTTTNQDSDQVRQSIRTLMGLILKHRGGSGFGSGYLKQPAEIQRFQDTLKEVLQVLQKESGATFNIDTYTSAASAAAAAPPRPAPTTSTSSTSAAVAASWTGTTSSTEAEALLLQSDSSLTSSLNQVEQAITTYRTSASAHGQAMDDLKHALQGALDATNPPPATRGTVPPSTTTTPTTMTAAASAAEDVTATTAAVPEPVEVPFPPTPKPSLTPVATELPPKSPRPHAVSSKTMSQSTFSSATTKTPPPTELKADELKVERLTNLNKKAENKPQEEKKKKKEEEEEEGVQGSVFDEENTNVLKKTQVALEEASGEAKFGLKNGMTPQEAAELANQLVDMRGILMDELGEASSSTTPPPPPEVPRATPDNPVTGVTAVQMGLTMTGEIPGVQENATGGTKYQEMLARAKAAKAAKDL